MAKSHQITSSAIFQVFSTTSMFLLITRSITFKQKGIFNMTVILTVLFWNTNSFLRRNVAQVLLNNQFEQWITSALRKYTSNTNQDLIISQALLLYFHDFVMASFTMWTLRMIHNTKHMQLSSKWWSKCMYFADLTRVIYLSSTPRSINYYRPQARGDRWPCSTHVVYFYKITQINFLVFLTLAIYFFYSN